MELDQQAKVFKALGNPQRLKLFQLLCEWQGGECCVEVTDAQVEECVGIERSFTKACCELSLSRSTVSHHFKELELAGLIQCRRSGNHSVCVVNRQLAEKLMPLMA